MSLRLLSISEIKKSITMAKAIEASENAFIQLATQQVELPLRSHIAIAEQEAQTLTMPGYLAVDKVLGLKMVSVFPHNREKHKPVITGFIMLLDEATGEPKILMDAGFLTALRTGAVSGLATKYFAIDDADHVAIIGAGAQAHTQLEAVAAVRPINKVSVWSRDIDNATAFAKQYEHQFEVQAFKSLSDAVNHVPIICTATASAEPLIHLQDLHPHVHINAVGSHTSSMQEISADVLKSSVVIVDQLSAALAEAGEIIHAVANHHINQADLVEMGSWLLQKRDNYQHQRSVFKSVGLAIQDLSVARVVSDYAIAHDLGTQFELHM